MFQRLFLVMLLAIVTLPLYAGYNNTADYWLCKNRVGGDWGYGRIPYACDVDSFGSPDFVRKNYQRLLFDESVDRNTERVRYMNDMNAAIGAIADYYLAKRKPGASAAEQQAWQRAVRAVANNESFWSQYRDHTDGKIKMVRGDSGHGHGMMQVDDRWHFDALNDGKGWHFVEHMFYALDIYYREWQRAATTWCVDDASNWRSRTRAAWAAYNGGGSKLCRWTNPDDAWARNDENFVAKYDQQPWLNYINDTSVSSPIDVACLGEGNENCSTGDSSEAYTNKLLIVDDGRVCVVTDTGFACTAERKDDVCLAKSVNASISAGSVEVKLADLSGTITDVDRHACADNVVGLYAVGDVITAEKYINVRATPGGLWLGTVTAGVNYQILDFEVQDEETMRRYYRVRVGAVEGYVYAGSTSNFASWATLTSTAAAEPVFSRVGEWIEIEALGINMRATPGGTKVGLVSAEQVLEVTDVVVTSATNRVYYGVTSNGVSGYIYGGAILPSMNLNNWAVMADAPVLGRTGEVGNYWWINFRSCPSTSCSVVSSLPGTRNIWSPAARVLELDERNGWSQIRDLRTNQVGWAASYLVNWD